MNLKLIMFVLFLFSRNLDKQGNEILGKWISTNKNVIVEVYKENKEFKAKVCWFNDADDPSKSTSIRTDYRNPNEDLRNRKIVGLDILKKLSYNPKTNRWEDGIIYDPLSGREWSSVIYFNNDGLLVVKGYWHYEFISKTLLFKRLSQ
ncbi:MAG: DUF2147 domain-containing protein [Oligoflexus sp.]|nr:DUF2147 domain-containing protein [Pseudopedobacter sp.]